MDTGEIPKFKSPEEESLYWKGKALELKEKVEELDQYLIDFQDSSSQVEKELEKSLEYSERANMDLKSKCNRLTLELDLCREKFEQHILQSSKQMSDSQKEVSDLKKNEEKLLKHIRDLEQKNDDLERSERIMIESLGNIEAKLNCVIERNAFLESELDDKETLEAMIQRLKDEQRDLQEELNRHKRRSIPDNEKYREYTKTPIDSNKLPLESQSTPRAKINPSVGQLSPPNRISAINLVGDLLKKVGLEKWLCPGCSRVKCNCGVFEALSVAPTTTSLESKLAASKASRDINESPIRELYRAKNQRINRGTSSPTFQNNVVKM